MAFTFSQGGIDLINGDLVYETDAEPITDQNVNDNGNPKYFDSAADRVPISKNTQIEDSDIDAGPIDCDQLVRNAAMTTDPGQFKFENSAVEISNSSSIRIGNSFNQKTDITFDRATSVIVDRRQWNYINCPDSKNVN